jgi:hypothetical protein
MPHTSAHFYATDAQARSSSVQTEGDFKKGDGNEKRSLVSVRSSAAFEPTFGQFINH